MSLSAGWIWIYVGCGLMLAELLAPGFVIFFFGLAAATVGALVLIMPETFQLNLTWQLAFFSLFSIVYLVTLRRYMKSVFCGDTSAVAVLEDEYVGRIGVITEAIQPNWIGRVRIGDAEWDATSSVALTVGEEVRVVSRANLTLNVEPSSGTLRE